MLDVVLGMVAVGVGTMAWTYPWSNARKLRFRRFLASARDTLWLLVSSKPRRLKLRGRYTKRVWNRIGRGISHTPPAKALVPGELHLSGTDVARICKNMGNVVFPTAPPGVVKASVPIPPRGGSAVLRPGGTVVGDPPPYRGIIKCTGCGGAQGEFTPKREENLRACGIRLTGFCERCNPTPTVLLILKESAAIVDRQQRASARAEPIHCNTCNLEADLPPEHADWVRETWDWGRVYTGWCHRCHPPETETPRDLTFGPVSSSVHCLGCKGVANVGPRLREHMRLYTSIRDRVRRGMAVSCDNCIDSEPRDCRGDLLSPDRIRRD